MTVTRRKVQCLLAAGALGLAGVSSGCGAIQPGLSNGAVTDCFKSLPAARAAIHSSGAHLLGVHRLAADQVRRRLNTGSLPVELDTTVCAVAFKGTFAAGQVAAAPGQESGQYAVVLINDKTLTVVASYVGVQLPRDLKGRTV